MAERRMFAKTIIDSDAFLDMPMSARLLYYDLAMRADDDGFVNSPKKIMRMIGATPDDFSILILRKFIIPFDNGVVVIKHWYIHNYIRKDTYNETPYKEQKELLEFDENKSYRLKDGVVTERLLPVDEPSTQVRLGKDSKGKNNKEFTPPTLEEVIEYAHQRGNKVDPQKFFDYYTAGKWKDAKGQPVKNWKQKMITWESRQEKQNEPEKNKKVHNYQEREYNYAELEKIANGNND